MVQLLIEQSYFHHIEYSYSLKKFFEAL